MDSSEYSPDDRLVLELLREQLGLELQAHKPHFVRQQWQTRMRQSGAQRAGYLERLRSDRAELEALGQALLVNVSWFFRDERAIDAVASSLRELVNGAARGAVLRLWVAGCAGGQEAYTLAALLSGEPRVQSEEVDFVIFASDANPLALSFAARAEYPLSAAVRIPADWRAALGSSEGEYFRVTESLRRRVRFEQHDVTTPPRHGELHCISCRNVLIYLKPAEQARVLQGFAAALLPEGLLWLGACEALNELESQYRVVDVEQRLFRNSGRALTTRV